MWLHLSFDSIIIISWTNGITKIPRVTTTSNIKPIQTTIVLIVFCCWPPHAFEQNGSIHDTCIFLFFFCKFFFYQKMKGNLYWIKKTQCKTIRCKKFEIHSVQNVTNAWSTSKWNKTRHIDLWTKEHWPSDLLITTSSNMLKHEFINQDEKKSCCYMF